MSDQVIVDLTDPRPAGEHGAAGDLKRLSGIGTIEQLTEFVRDENV